MKIDKIDSLIKENGMRIALRMHPKNRGISVQVKRVKHCTEYLRV